MSMPPIAILPSNGVASDCVFQPKNIPASERKMKPNATVRMKTLACDCPMIRRMTCASIR